MVITVNINNLISPIKRQTLLALFKGNMFLRKPSIKSLKKVKNKEL